MNTYVCMIIVIVYSYCSLMIVDVRRCPSMFVNVRRCSCFVILSITRNMVPIKKRVSSFL